MQVTTADIPVAIEGIRMDFTRSDSFCWTMRCGTRPLAERSASWLGGVSKTALSSSKNTGEGIAEGASGAGIRSLHVIGVVVELGLGLGLPEA
jgi:hypothetical protein